MKSAIRLVAAMICVSAASAVVIGEPAAAGDRTTTKAWFGDHWIDMGSSWESATACAVTASGAVCFATEREMDAYLVPAATTATASSVAPALVCSTSMRLYDGASYTGNLLYLSSQGTFLNLGNYGFNNMTTSYKIGACDSYFYSSASGGGSLYPIGNTQAFDQFPTMLVGWNNAVSSVYMN
jgi:hypothetical protein